jgi:hypothetical protein
MAKQERVRCFGCDEEGAISSMYRKEYYDHPFDDEPSIVYFHKRVPAKFKGDESFKHGETCEDLVTHGGDFSYFLCERCNRMVCQQNPSNGWHVQYREVWGEQMCLKCYEKMILEEGIGREGFEEGHLEGMFFNNGNPEPLEAGYIVDERVNNTKVAGGAKVKEICAIALAHIDAGHKVVIGYESMAIGGIEGYITLFYKEA